MVAHAAVAVPAVRAADLRLARDSRAPDPRRPAHELDRSARRPVRIRRLFAHRAGDMDNPSGMRDTRRVHRARAPDGWRETDAVGARLRRGQFVPDAARAVARAGNRRAETQNQHRGLRRRDRISSDRPSAFAGDKRSRRDDGGDDRASRVARGRYRSAQSARVLPRNMALDGGAGADSGDCRRR